MMRDQKIEFTYYDIIEDEYMRYWLRHYSGVATYPMVFSQGKFVGGLDQCQELVKKGEFIQYFPKSCQVTSVEDKYACLLKEYPVIVFTDGFSFEKSGT